MKRVIIIGGGAAGMLAAIRSAECGAQVILFEKMDQVGRKLLITGKGRCNFTNTLSNEEFIENIPNNGKFLYSALKNFSPVDTVNFFENLGIKTKVERGGRVFPQSDRSRDIVNALLKKMFSLNVKLEYKSAVRKIIVKRGKACGVLVKRKIFRADAVILATGGVSYPATGSTGDGFRIAKELGHTITKIFPALVPLEVKESFVRTLQGLTLKNVSIKLLVNGKRVDEVFGEMLFTHFGVSGPIILTLSRQISQFLSEKLKIELKINLKPALTIEKLDARLLRDFEKFKYKTIKNALVDLLPKRLIQTVLRLSDVDEHLQLHEMTALKRRRLIETLQGISLMVTKVRPIEEAIVTAGGISTKEIDPKTMQSKLIQGLFIVGEVVDIDGFTGGFNLQAAWSMGYTAGIYSVK